MSASPNPVYSGVKQTIERLSPTWVERLGIAHWEIEHLYLESQFLDEPIQDEFLITATTEARWNYFQAKVKWYLPSAIRHSPEHLERTLVHELCHVVLAPEQSLHEVKLQAVLERGDVENDDYERYQAMFYERQEMATEAMTRSIMLAWPSVL